jgi:hypothetical protein
MKKNPDDEMLLAEMIAAAKSRGLKHCTESHFKDSGGNCTTHHDLAVSCCALGARELLGLFDHKYYMALGNDTFLDPDFGDSFSDLFMNDKDCEEFDIGYAFALAMQEDGEACQT